MSRAHAYDEVSRPTPLTGWRVALGRGQRFWPLVGEVPLPILFWTLLPIWLGWVLYSLYYDDGLAAAYTIENGALQNLTVAGYLLATALFAHAWVRTSPAAWLRRWSFLLLVAGSAFVALEEVNWGQSFLHFATPSFLEQANLQQEVSLHNLELPGPLAGRHWANEVLWMLTAIGGIILPVLLLMSPAVRDFVRRHGVPVPPWVAQAFCFAAAIIPKDGDLLGQLSRDNIPSELREVTVAIAIAIWAWSAWRAAGSKRPLMIGRVERVTATTGVFCAPPVDRADGRC